MSKFNISWKKSTSETRTFFKNLYWFPMSLIAIFLTIGILTIAGGMLSDDNGNLLRNPNDIGLLTLFTLPLIIGSLLKLPGQNKNEYASNQLLLSSILLIIGYVLFRTTAPLNLGGFYTFMEGSGIVILFTGSFLFSYALVKIGFYVTIDLLSDLINMYKK